MTNLHSFSILASLLLKGLGLFIKLLSEWNKGLYDSKFVQID